MLLLPHPAGMVSSLCSCLFAYSVILCFPLLSGDIQGLTISLTGKFFGFSIIADEMVFSFASED